MVLDPREIAVPGANPYLTIGSQIGKLFGFDPVGNLLGGGSPFGMDKHTPVRFDRLDIPSTANPVAKSVLEVAGFPDPDTQISRQRYTESFFEGLDNRLSRAFNQTSQRIQAVNDLLPDKGFDKLAKTLRETYEARRAPKNQSNTRGFGQIRGYQDVINSIVDSESLIDRTFQALASQEGLSDTQIAQVRQFKEEFDRQALKSDYQALVDSSQGRLNEAQGRRQLLSPGNSGINNVRGRGANLASVTNQRGERLNSPIPFFGGSEAAEQAEFNRRTGLLNKYSTPLVEDFAGLGEVIRGIGSGIQIGPGTVTTTEPAQQPQEPKKESNVRDVADTLSKFLTNLTTRRAKLGDTAAVSFSGFGGGLDDLLGFGAPKGFAIGKQGTSTGLSGSGGSQLPIGIDELEQLG